MSLMHSFRTHSHLLFFICGESMLITEAQISCSRGANSLAKPISRMKCKIMQSEEYLGKSTCLYPSIPLSQWLKHSGGCVSGSLTFVCRIDCLDTWKKYPCNPEGGELASSMGFYFICFVISFLLSSSIFSNSKVNFHIREILKYLSACSSELFSLFLMTCFQSWISLATSLVVNTKRIELHLLTCLTAEVLSCSLLPGSDYEGKWKKKNPV